MLIGEVWRDLKTAKKPKPPALERVLAGPVRKSGAEAAGRGLGHGAAISAATQVQRDLANLRDGVVSRPVAWRIYRKPGRSSPQTDCGYSGYISLKTASVT